MGLQIPFPLLFAAKGGEVPNPKLAAVNPEHRFPGHLTMPPHLQQVASIYHGNKFGDVSKMPKFGYGGMLEGGKVPGQAKMSGDHYANDTVKAKLSPGEVVIPKSVMESEDPIKGAAQFVAALQKKKGTSSHSSLDKSDFKEALSRAIKNRKKQT